MIYSNTYKAAIKHFSLHQTRKYIGNYTGNIACKISVIYFRHSVSQGGGNDKEGKGQKVVKQPFTIWPEWSDQDIASEKWVCQHVNKKSVFFLDSVNELQNTLLRMSDHCFKQLGHSMFRCGLPFYLTLNAIQFCSSRRKFYGN